MLRLFASVMRGKMLFLTCLLMAACQSGTPATAPPMPITVNTPTGSPTSVILPTEYRPHPALRQILAADDAYPPNPNWDDNDTLSFEREEFNRQTECQDFFRRTYSLASSSWQTFTMSSCPPQPCRAGCSVKISDEIKNRKEFTGELTEQLVSPDGNWSLITEKVVTPTTSNLLGDANADMIGIGVHQLWIANNTSKELHLLFFTKELFDYTWTPDSKYLVAWSSCFGAQGFYTIDPFAAKTYTLDTKNQICEDGFSLLIAPDSKHILYENGIVSDLTGSNQTHICGDKNYTHSYVWSQDGRYAYVVCSDKTSDTLRRYDTQTKKNELIIGDQNLIFRALRPAVSPNQKHFAFAWEDSFMHPDYRGIWVIDLSK